MIDGDGKSMFRTPYLALETSAASEKMRFDIDNGRFGIGENSPDTALHIKSSTASEPVITIENTNADGTPPGITFFKNTASPASGDQVGSIKFNSKEATSGDTKTYWEIQPRINDATNTTPNGQLNFYGLDGDSPGFIHQFQFINSQFSVLNSDGVGPTIAPTGTNGALFKSQGNKMRLQAKSDGTGEIHMIANQVGIGTTSPSTKLFVTTADELVATFESTDDTARIRLLDNDTSNYLVSAGDTFSLGSQTTVASANVNISAVGHIGVGNTAPTFGIDVSGASTRTAMANVPYIFDVHAGFQLQAAIQPNAGNIAMIAPDAGTPAAGITIPVQLPASSAVTTGLEITVVQDTANDPGAALAVQVAQGTSDVIYEGGSNSPSSTVSIAANRGANKTFINVASGFWVAKT